MTRHDVETFSTGYRCGIWAYALCAFFRVATLNFLGSLPFERKHRLGACHQEAQDSELDVIENEGEYRRKRGGAGRACQDSGMG